MINRYKILLILCLGLLFPLLGSAQNDKSNEIEVSSKVTDAEGTPIEGAEVYAQEGAIITYTDQEGFFTIKAEPSGILLIEAEGYTNLKIAVGEIVAAGVIKLESLPFHLRETDVVNIPFGQRKKRHLVGNVTALNIEDILMYDNEQTFNGVLNSRVPGLFGNNNVRGLGNALVVVDGVPRSASSLNMQEIDQVSVLRDLSARMLYGAQADQGVILVTTKRGKAFKRRMNVTVESGILDPISFPNFLGAADYMTLYNEALANDGLDPLYTQDQIDQTRSGQDRVLFPDEDYYNSTYLRDFNTFHKVITEASGGNDAAQYYVNLGWNQINSLLNVGEGADERTDRINLRANVDYQLNDWLKMSLDGIALIDIARTPRYTDGDFYNIASTLLPNAYPTLIPANLLEDSGLLPSAVLINGNSVLGGSSQDQFNEVNILGELTRNGFQQTTNRVIQINTGLDFNLEGILKGLKGKAFLTFDFNNQFTRQQTNSYAIYEPFLSVDSTGQTLMFNKIGVDEQTGTQNIANSSVLFDRRVGLYGILDYNRSFGGNPLNITALAYRDQVNVVGDVQPLKHLHFALRGNYVINNKYVVEAAGVYAGSPIFDDNKYAFSPSVGLGWILSEEDFLKGNSLINYLKVKANWGILNTDAGVGNFLFLSTFQQGGNFQYNDGVFQNNIVNAAAGNQDLDWIKRQEINVGVEALIAKNFFIEATYFNSESYDQLAQLTGVYPGILGGEDWTPFENFESDRTQGIELGIDWNKQIGDFGIGIGANFVYAETLNEDVNESDNLPDNLKRSGNPTDGIFALVAEGLFQNQEEIDAHAVQNFGGSIVQPGDIKYKDLNGDGIINQNDQQLIGNTAPRFQYGLNLRLQYKNFELFAQGLGQVDSDRFFNNQYFWVFGQRKYSDVVLDRWTPGTAASAAYPRLTTTNGANNFRNSTYWLFSEDFFQLRRLQLTYKLPINYQAIRDIRVYVRGANLFNIAENNDRLQLNTSTSPQSRAYALGLLARF